MRIGQDKNQSFHHKVNFRPKHGLKMSTLNAYSRIDNCRRYKFTDLRFVIVLE